MERERTRWGRPSRFASATIGIGMASPGSLGAAMFPGHCRERRASTWSMCNSEMRRAGLPSQRTRSSSREKGLSSRHPFRLLLHLNLRLPLSRLRILPSRRLRQSLHLCPSPLWPPRRRHPRCPAPRSLCPHLPPDLVAPRLFPPGRRSRRSCPRSRANHNLLFVCSGLCRGWSSCSGSISFCAAGGAGGLKSPRMMSETT
jgi:hypothetical protein